MNQETLEMIKSLMTDAVETGCISYWADIRNIKRDEELNIIQFDVRDNGDGYPENRISDQWITITPEIVNQFIPKLGHFDINEKIIAQFAGDPDDWYYDDDGIDYLIQAICFGNIAFS